MKLRPHCGVYRTTPRFVSYSFLSGGAASIPLPAGHQLNDILLLVTSIGNPSVAPIVLPAGYTEITPGTASFDTVAPNFLQAAWKRDNGAEAAPAIPAENDGYNVMLCFRDCVLTGSPIDAVAGNSTQSSGGLNTCTWPSITTTAPAREIVLIVATSAGSNSGNWNLPVNAGFSSIVERLDEGISADTQVAVSTAVSSLTSAGATGTTTATKAAGIALTPRWVAIIAALKGLPG